MPTSDVALNEARLSSSLSSIFRGKFCAAVLVNRSAITFERGATIYDADDKGRMFFFVRRGVVKLGTVTEEGHELIYDLRKEGDVIGELCASQSPRRDRAVALEPTEVIAVPYDEILDSLQRDRSLLREILAVICRSLSDAYDQADLLSSRDTVQRLIKLLVNLADRLGRPAGQWVELSAYLTQEEISQMMAASRERVSLALNFLRARGMVQYSRGGRLLLDVTALTKYQP